MIGIKFAMLLAFLSTLEVAAPRTTMKPKAHLPHPYGTQVNILRINDDDTLDIDYDSFKGLFNHPDVRDRNIAVVSIIGTYRRGKSFFMDYCLRFMYANYKSVNFKNNPLANKRDWMGQPDEPLTGFSWKAGSVRHTTGIIFWNDLFLYENPVTREKAAIALVDTQGLFDRQTTAISNSRIFALGTLMSSVQIVNLFGVIQEDQLQYLQLAAAFAKFAQSDSRTATAKPFQNLRFLIRDWVHIQNHPFGLEGGDEYIKSILDINDKNQEELRSVRQYIYDSFESISCFLMPRPPKAVSQGKMKNGEAYDGRLSEMDDEFRDSLKEAIESLLSTENLQLKQINGEKIPAFRYSELAEEYLKVFARNDTPGAESLYEITIRKRLQALTDDLKNTYESQMYKSINISDVHLEDNFKVIHDYWLNVTLLEYANWKKMGSKKHHKEFAEILVKSIHASMKKIEKQSFNEHDKFMENQKKATIYIEGLNDKHNVMLQQMIEIDFALKYLERNKNDLDRRSYFSRYQSLSLSKHALQQRIDNYANQQETQEFLSNLIKHIPVPQPQFIYDFDAERKELMEDFRGMIENLPKPEVVNIRQGIL